MNLLQPTISLFCLFLFSFSSIFAQTFVHENGKNVTPWEVTKEKDGVIARTRRVEGEPLKEFKIMTVIDVPLDSVRKILSHPEWFPKFMPSVPEMRVIDTLPGGSKIVYYTINMPMGAPDRDGITQQDCADMTDGFLLRILSRPDYIPENENYIRLKRSDLMWIARQLGPTQTEVTYMGSTSAGGKLPLWLANMAIDKIPYENVLGLKHLLEQQYVPAFPAPQKP